MKKLVTALKAGFVLMFLAYIVLILLTMISGVAVLIATALPNVSMSTAVYSSIVLFFSALGGIVVVLEEGNK
jgi:cytochrome b subunit of formate dehydrogenase